MTETINASFSTRVREIERRHSQLNAGFVRLEERDGLLVPVERVPTRRGLPLRGIIYSLAIFLLFKGFLLSYLGPQTFADRIAMLNSGSVVEQLGAWLMTADPATQYIAAQIGTLF